MSCFTNKKKYLYPNYTVAELLKILNAHKHKYIIYFAYQIVANIDHGVLKNCCLITVNCQYNLIISAQVKKLDADKTLKIQDVEKLFIVS